MFSENLRSIRQAKGFTQEDLAARLHVVRQTISKWEKGLSVPDAQLLIRLAEVLEVPVSRLLGAELPQNEEGRDALAEQLARINAQLAVRNRRGRFVLRLVLGILGVIVALNLLLVACNFAAFRSVQDPVETKTSAQAEFFSPTAESAFRSPEASVDASGKFFGRSRDFILDISKPL